MNKSIDIKINIFNNVCCFIDMTVYTRVRCLYFIVKRFTLER